MLHGISQVLSLAGIICSIVLVIFCTKISLNNIKKLITSALCLKALTLIGLFFINHTGMILFIRIFIILDMVLEKIITTNIYPFIVTIKKDDRLYSKRKLVEYLFSDIGILIGGIFIGKTIANVVINYNLCLLIAILFLLCAFVTIINIKNQKNTKTQEEKGNYKNVIAYIVKDKITRLYFIYLLVGNIGMNTGLGLKMLMLTNAFQFTDSMATNYLLVIGLFADLIGIIALKYLTPKSDYVTVTIKFGIRFSLYVLAFISNNLVICLIAMTWSILISTSYENIIDGIYINRVPNKYQVIFTNYRYIVGIIGTSIGMYLAGIIYQFGVHYLLGVSSLFMISQIEISYYLIYLREKESQKTVLYNNEVSEIQC